MRKIACQNLKGGTGKTTTVVSLASCLASKDKKILDIFNAAMIVLGKRISFNKIKNDVCVRRLSAWQMKL